LTLLRHQHTSARYVLNRNLDLALWFHFEPHNNEWDNEDLGTLEHGINVRVVATPHRMSVVCLNLTGKAAFSVRPVRTRVSRGTGVLGKLIAIC
jgi:hypothetical protein